MARTQKQRLIAVRLAAECVAGGVAGRIRLGFNDDSAQPRCRELVDQRLADQISRKRHRPRGQVRPAQALEGERKGVRRDYLLPSDARKTGTQEDVSVDRVIVC